MQRIAVFLLVLLAVACQKEKLPTEENSAQPTQAVKQYADKLTAVKLFLKNKVDPSLDNLLEWEGATRIEKQGKLKAWKVGMKGSDRLNVQFVLVNVDQNGNPGSASRNIVRYETRFGIDRFPVFILNQNYATGVTKQYFTVDTDMGGSGRNVKRLSLDGGGTLPMVTVIGQYGNGSTTGVVSGSAAYILAAMLGMEGSSGGSSGEGTGNGDGAFNNYTNLDYLDPLYGTSGGGTVYDNPPPAVITWEMDESDKKPAIDIEKYLKCFDNIPDAGATYQVKVYVDIPVNQTPDVLIGTSQSTGEFGPGHVFMKLSKFNGSQTVSQVFGFYPANGLKSATMNAVPSKMVDDGNAQGTQHEFNASMSMGNWNGPEFRQLLQQIRSNSTRQYELDQFNCANFVATCINGVKPGTLASDPVLVYD
ncbi:MAG TPA: hypothetical protein VLL95_05185, partial [Phnomibacter sp.]|nr:hypothetical protein [Phnomibacter sp.]